MLYMLGIKMFVTEFHKDYSSDLNAVEQMATAALSEAKRATTETVPAHVSHDSKKPTDKPTRIAKLTSKELLARLYDGSESDQALRAANHAGSRMLHRPKAVTVQWYSFLNCIILINAYELMASSSNFG
jgi:hypothetical protein